MRRVAVIGAGTMGHGIAQVAAMAGYFTVLTDTNPSTLDTARERVQHNLDGGVSRGKISPEQAAETMERLSINPQLAAAVSSANLVIEAVVEDMAVKRRLFEEVSQLVAPESILATNTSSLSVAKIASAASRPERVIGMHFFNPVHIMKLVELVVHDAVSEQVVTEAREAVERMDKEPIIVKDFPGFASSRLGVVLGLEAMRMLEQGVASAADIDRAMELGYGHPMGPLRVTDLVGLDVRLAIAEYLQESIGGEQYRAPEILRRKVDAGELGKKTGRGFYEWQKT